MIVSARSYRRIHDAIRTGARLSPPVRAGVHGLRPAARPGDGGGLPPRGAEARPRFFPGFLTSPGIAARGLLAVTDVAAARYHRQERSGSLDPVVTGNGDRLRFESFSGCGGMYTRLDVLFDQRAELSGPEAVRFLRSLPRGRARGRGPLWIAPSGRSLRPTTRPGAGAVCLPGPERPAALERALRHAPGLRVYGPVPDGTMATASAWEPRIDPADLAAQVGLTVDRVRAALTRLGTAGRVGYDVADAACFHRELPYDADRAERHNPRLVGARRLVAEGAVELDGEPATVTSGDRRHRVREVEGALGWTCRWWAGHRGLRGPCKHALAVRMARRRATAVGGAA